MSTLLSERRPRRSISASDHDDGVQDAKGIADDEDEDNGEEVDVGDGRRAGMPTLHRSYCENCCCWC